MLLFLMKDVVDARFMTISRHVEKALKGDEISEPKIYTCNCKTPLYQAAPEMYRELKRHCTLCQFAASGMRELQGLPNASRFESRRDEK